MKHSRKPHWLAMWLRDVANRAIEVGGIRELHLAQTGLPDGEPRPESFSVELRNGEVYVVSVEQIRGAP